MTLFDWFHALINVHIATGAVGLVAFWVPVIAKKGSFWHRRAGQVFTVCMLVAGAAAVLMSICTVVDPMGTHPQLLTHEVFSNPAVVRAVFGWMMLGLAILTLNLAWYGWQCVRHKRNQAAQRGWINLALQAATFVAATNAAWQGFLIGTPLMLGMSIVGWATVGTNLYFLYHPKPAPNAWLKEHIKALVGTGISVYTAFFAFGAVRTFPALALHPVLWAIPLTVGLGLIVYHQRKVSRPVAQGL
jgi:hypothetical protein